MNQGANEYNAKINKLKEVSRLQSELQIANNNLNDSKALMNSIPQGIEEELEILEKVEAANAVVPEISISRYTVNLPNRITLTCSSTDEFRPDDFISELSKDFIVPENLSISNKGVFNLQLTLK